MKIEEYVPEMMPTSRAMTNQRMDSPPNNNKAVSVTVTVSEVLKDRFKVSVME